ncbi:MAG: hypothetical protein R3C69_10380 [Geminicoccaceae bacterium]
MSRSPRPCSPASTTSRPISPGFGCARSRCATRRSASSISSPSWLPPKLLADAKVDAIIWSSTAAGWRGFATDEALRERITERTGIPAGTSVLALNEIFAATGVRRFGLVTPYLDEIQAPIVANYRAAGFDCVAERHLLDRGNFSFALYSETLIASLIREVAAAKPDAITVFCTTSRHRPRRIARAGTRHPDLRHGRHRRLAGPAPHRRRSRPRHRLGPGLPRSQVTRSGRRKVSRFKVSSGLR